MIYITFKHSIDVFKGDLFIQWIEHFFPHAKFTGCEFGNFFPTIEIHLSEFEKNKNFIPDYAQKNIVKIEGKFNTLEMLVFGVRSFSNDLRIK